MRTPRRGRRRGRTGSGWCRRRARSGRSRRRSSRTGWRRCPGARDRGSCAGDDRHVEPGGGRPQAGPLGGQLGVAVVLLRARDRGGQHRILLGHTEHGARRRVDDLGDAGVGARVEQRGGAVDVDRAQQVTVTGERHLSDVVEHDIDAVDRARTASRSRMSASTTSNPSPSAPVTSMSRMRTESPRATRWPASN